VSPDENRPSEPIENRPHREVQGRLYSHPGYLEYLRLEAFEQSLNAVFLGNLAELVRLLEYAADLSVGMELTTGANPQRQREFTAQVAQRLHNYTAATSALVDHSRRLMQDRPDALAAEVDAKKLALLAYPEVSFIKDLRNYMQHRSLPTILHRAALRELNTGAPRTESEVTLSAEQLLTWDRWSAASKGFLRGLGGNFALRPVVHTHGYEVFQFNSWLLDLLAEQNRADLAGANELIVERNAVFNRIDLAEARRLTEQWTKRRSSLNENADADSGREA
jgi:hypothetical protein